MTEQTGAQSDQPKKLYRLKNNRIVGGVCTGFADYLNIDATIVRIVWVLLVLWGGIGVLAYIAGLILIPENPSEEIVESTENRTSNNSAIVVGVILILFGLFFLSDEFDFWNFHRFFFWPHFFHWRMFWPVLIIAAGILYIVYVLRRDPGAGPHFEMPKDWVIGGKRFYRVTSRKMIAGVCAGVAEYLNIDIAFVRLGWVVFTIFATWFSVISYIVLAIVLPTEDSALTHPYSGETSVRPGKVEKLISEKEEK